MPSHRWHLIPLLLVALGAAASVLAAIVARNQLGWWQVLIYAGSAVALAAVFFFRRQLTEVEQEAEALRRRLADDETRLASERAQAEELRRTVQQELEQQAQRLARREQALAARLVTFHEWMEFPQPIELSTALAADRLGGFMPALPAPGQTDLARKDRELERLLKAETLALYERILANRYSVDGQLQLPAVRDDALALVHRVASLYQPGIQEPLLEASMIPIVRGAGRACLQLLVVIDELPGSIRTANLSTLYGYVRNAVKAWQLYKTSEPYWPYFNAAFYLGRFAMGANPLALGAWWFVGALSQRGAKAVVSHLVNRQALALVSNLVRIIGYEVASVYGGDFRHRDANWIYAAELTELLAEFPLSRDSLAHALREIGSLELRSEYDRIFLYRALASHQSARPQQYRPAEFLTSDERHAIAGRLEKFLAAFVHGKSADRVQAWKKGAEERLSVRMSVAMAPTALSVRQQLDDALRSLASFLVATKQLEPGDLASHLQTTRTLAEIPSEVRKGVVAALVDNPPFFFEHPDLDPDGDLVGIYLDDLACLHARTPPRDAATDDTLCDVAAYLRREGKSMRGLLDKHFTAQLAARLAADAPVRKVSGTVARAALDLLEPGEAACWLYGGVALEWPESAESPTAASELWLLGAGSRLVLFSAGNLPQVLWRGDKTTSAEQVRNMLLTSCRLVGGEWLAAGPQPLALRIPTGMMHTFASYFRPLLTLVGSRHG
jgi:hypothetical protein